MTTITETMILHAKGEVITGTNKRGETWSKQEIVLKDPENDYRHIALSLWGDEIAEFEDLTTGEPVEVEYYANSREWNGKWYTDLKLVKVTAKDLPF